LKRTLNRKRKITLVVPHPETVKTVPAGASYSEVGGGRLTGLAEGTLRSNGSVNFSVKTINQIPFRELKNELS
jgi:hypothetical protein